MIASILNWIGNFFQNALNVVLMFFTDLFGWLFKGIVDLLTKLFNPVIILVAIIFYFVYKLGELIVMLFRVLLAIGKLLYSLVMGLINTLAGLSWTPTTPNHGSWSGAIRESFTALSLFQLDNIAYVLSFLVWFFTVFMAIRILSSRGGENG